MTGILAMMTMTAACTADPSTARIIGPPEAVAVRAPRDGASLTPSARKALGAQLHRRSFPRGRRSHTSCRPFPGLRRVARIVYLRIHQRQNVIRAGRSYQYTFA